MNRKLIFKSPRFDSFDADLAQLETRSDITGVTEYMSQIDVMSPTIWP